MPNNAKLSFLKKISYLLVVFIFLVIAWGSLDDITTSNEQNLFLEYSALFIASPILGYLFAHFFKNKAFKLQKKISRYTPLRNYHIHHSLVGIMLVFLGFSLNPFWLKITTSGFGLGLFLHHALNEGLVFLTKD